MAFWTDNTLEIKQKFRFIVSIGSGFFLPNVKTCAKPSAEVEIKEYKLVNHYFKYPGLVKWNAIKITMVDMRGGDNKDELDTAVLLARMLKHTGYNFPTNASGPIGLISKGATVKRDGSRSEYNPSLSVPEKAATVANTFGPGIQGVTDFSEAGVGTASNNQSVRIYQLNAKGSIVEQWVLHNPIIKSISWGELDYSADDPVEYSIDIDYDWAELAGSFGDGEKIGAFADGAPITKQYESFMKVLREQPTVAEIVERNIIKEQQITEEDLQFETQLGQSTVGDDLRQLINTAMAEGLTEEEAIEEINNIGSGF